MAVTHLADTASHPRAADQPPSVATTGAAVSARTAELEPGDALYMPPLWWHQVESLEPLNALVNYWWMPAQLEGRATTPALGALLHARLAFASLPTRERQDWRTLFDHYVFSDGDPAAHIPEARRGVLGELDADALAALRERIRSGL